MNFIDEENGSFTIAGGLASFLNGLTQVLYTGEHGGEWNESLATLVGQQARQCRLARAGRTPKNH
jgi:hypothetical protein